MHNNESCPRITNCVFQGNISSESVGGGMFNNTNSTPTITNCTFSGNSADTKGGGMHNSNNSNPTVADSVFWDNSDEGGTDESAQIHDEVGSTSEVTYSCIQGCTAFCSNPDDHNIGDDPLFVDPDGDDDIPGTEDDNLRLSVWSPCIDEGDNSVVTEATDLDGNPRIVDGDFDGTPTVDMGAYEHQGDEPIPTVSEWGMVAMTLLLLAAGTLVFIRKRQTA